MTQVEFTYGRDVKGEDISKILNTLNSWVDHIDGVEKFFEKQSKDCSESLVKSHDRQKKFNDEMEGLKDDYLKKLSSMGDVRTSN